MFPFRVNDIITIDLLQQDDKQKLFDLIDDNRSQLRKWLLWVDKRQSPSDFEPIIPIWIQNYADNNGFDAGIKFNNKLVGMLGLHYIDWKNKTTSIGNRVIIQCAEMNLKSRAIPERLGFVNEGVSREGQWLYDHYENLVTYSLLAKDSKANEDASKLN